ncbi:MAG: LLM class flavin-dependent oxidoreductase [Microbacterium sp.]|nr:LLM class flavin-dependent oxidoreductase [Microbacterium sp.]
MNAQINITSGLSLDDALEAVAAFESAGVTAVTLKPGETGLGAPAFEPNTLAGALANRTDRVGIIVADSALYGFPYHLARRLATLDHLTGGRAGWAPRIRSTPAEAAAYEWRTNDEPACELARASEYAEILLELWDSWEPGAERPDKASGDFKDDSRIHRIEYHSPSFFVRGPLDTPRSPQQRPLIAVDLADACELPFAAAFADIVVVDAPDATRLADLIAALEVARDTDPRRILTLAAVHRPGVAAADDVAGVVERAQLDGVTLWTDGSPAAIERTLQCIELLRERHGLRVPASGQTFARSLGIEHDLAVGKRVAA